VGSPLTATQLRTPCNATAWIPNPCDAELEARRDRFFAAPTPEARQQAMDALQERFYEVVPYLVAGQFLAPKAWRSNVTGVVNASEFVFWNVEKK
jgi:peptide/nickel transport system substrate-binding protein